MAGNVQSASSVQEIVNSVINNLSHRCRDKKILGNLSKPRRQRQRERRQTKGLMSKTIAVHVRYKSLYISLPFSAKQQREMTKFGVFWRTRATTANILDFLMEMIASITYLVFEGFWTDLLSERV